MEKEKMSLEEFGVRKQYGEEDNYIFTGYYVNDIILDEHAVDNKIDEEENHTEKSRELFCSQFSEKVKLEFVDNSEYEIQLIDKHRIECCSCEKVTWEDESYGDIDDFIWLSEEDGYQCTDCHKE